MVEQVTLWTESGPRLYCGRAEIVSKEPTFVLKVLYSDMKAQAILRDMGSRYHYFRILSELGDQATTFWPYQFWLLSTKVSPEIVTESEAQFMYLRFRVEREEKVDFSFTTCGSRDAYLYRPVGVRGHYCD